MLIKVCNGNSCAFYNLSNITCIEAMVGKKGEEFLYVSFIDGKKVCLKGETAKAFYGEVQLIAMQNKYS